MLADMAMKIEAARQLTYHAAGLSEWAMRGRKVPELTFASAAAKCFASDTAMQVTTDAVQLLGGYGYVNDYPVERMMRDAKITQIYEGTNQVQRMVMARQLLRGVHLRWDSFSPEATSRPCLEAGSGLELQPVVPGWEPSPRPLASSRVQGDLSRRCLLSFGDGPQQLDEGPVRGPGVFGGTREQPAQVLEVDRVHAEPPSDRSTVSTM